MTMDKLTYKQRAYLKLVERRDGLVEIIQTTERLGAIVPDEVRMQFKHVEHEMSALRTRGVRKRNFRKVFS